MMQTASVVVFEGSLIIGWSVPADAQSTPFNYQITPYLWLSGLDGAVGARNRTADLTNSRRLS